MTESTQPQPAGRRRKAPTPPAQAVHWHKALFWHGLGFVTIVVLLWGDALFNFWHLAGIGEQQDADFREVTTKSGVIVMLWMFSAYKIYHIVSRLTYLESFLHVCAWCRKLEVKQKWLTIEQHFAQQAGVKTSHGMCPECAREMEQEIVKMSGDAPAAE